MTSLVIARPSLLTPTAGAMRPLVREGTGWGRRGDLAENDFDHPSGG